MAGKQRLHILLQLLEKQLKYLYSKPVKPKPFCIFKYKRV